MDAGFLVLRFLMDMGGLRRVVFNEGPATFSGFYKKFVVADQGENFAVGPNTILAKHLFTAEFTRVIDLIGNEFCKIFI